jgi:branched-chain amino acid aminotransferase
LAVASELGLELRFESPTVEELLVMDEVFISSSIRELLPVVRVDGQFIKGGRPGAITARLHEAFKARVRAEMRL